LKLSQAYKWLKSSWAIGHVNVELKSISEISAVSIMRVNVVNNRVPDIYTSLSNQCLILLVCYAAAGESKCVVTTQIKPVTMLLNLLSVNLFSFGHAVQCIFL
jgi:hypothetical protein